MRNHPARTAEQIEADVKAEREEMRVRWAREDAARASGKECDARIEAEKLRNLAERSEDMARETRDTEVSATYRESAVKLRQKADVLDPPKPEPSVVRETMFVWFMTEKSDGSVGLSRYLCPEPSSELTREVGALLVHAWNARHADGGNGNIYVDGDRLKVLKREVFSSLTHELGCRVFNTSGTPEGKIWAEAMAMFEKYRDSDFPF